MKIFITGATGYIGSAVARTVRDAGHDVLALAHRGSAEEILEEEGYELAPGDLRNPDSLPEHARAADAVVHTANTNDDDAAEVDRAAVTAMVRALEGTDRPFVYTSGIWVLGDTGGDEVDENTATDAAELAAWRAGLEKWLVEEGARHVRTVVVRPGVVHGRNGGITALMAAGKLPVVGDGEQSWPLVHVDDLADLYLKALEKAPPGSVLHGVSHHATMAEVARAVSDGEPQHVPLGQAREQMGPFADALALDQRLSAAETRKVTGWEPARTAVG